MAEGANLLALAVGSDIAGAPHVAHAGIDGEDGIFIRVSINEVCNVLWVDRGVLIHVGCVGLHDVLQLAVVLLEHLVQEGAVLLLIHVRQDVLDGSGYVAGNRIRNLGAAADVGAVDVHLCHVGIRQEVVIREVGTQQDEQVSLVGGLVCRTVAQQAVHAHIEWVLVLDVHLATQGVADRSLNLLRQLQHLFAGILGASANEEGDSLSLVDGLGQGRSLGWVREDDWATSRDLGLHKGVIVGVLHGDVARDDQDGNAVACHSGLDGMVQDNTALLSGIDHLAITRALLEDCLWVGLLEELGADLTGWNVGSQCQNLGAVAVGVI